MADSRFEDDKPLTFNCDLDLGCGNLLILLYLSVKFDLIPLIDF